jgi:hypothetical protein
MNPCCTSTKKSNNDYSPPYLDLNPTGRHKNQKELLTGHGTTQARASFLKETSKTWL